MTKVLTLFVVVGLLATPGSAGPLREHAVTLASKTMPAQAAQATSPQPRGRSTGKTIASIAVFGLGIGQMAKPGETCEAAAIGQFLAVDCKRSAGGTWAGAALTTAGALMLWKWR